MRAAHSEAARLLYPVAAPIVIKGAGSVQPNFLAAGGKRSNQFSMGFIFVFLPLPVRFKTCTGD